VIKIVYDPRRPARFRLVSGQDDSELIIDGLGLIALLGMTANLLYHTFR